MYRLEYTSLDTTTHVAGEGHTIVTCVTVMNGAIPNFSLDQYRKSSAPASGADGNACKWAGNPGTSVPRARACASSPANSSMGRIGRFPSSYCEMRPAPPDTYPTT